jgi:uncharacterized membrane-anchored protein
MRVKFIIVVLLQVVLLLGILGYRQYWVATGEKILLRTMPVDPRDLFRGDYVSLTYEISTLDLDDLNVKDHFRPDENIYVTLDPNIDGTMRASSVHKSIPEGRKFIQGRVKHQGSVTRWEITFRDGAGNIYHLIRAGLSGLRQGDPVVFCVDTQGNVTGHYNAGLGPNIQRCGADRQSLGVVEAIQERKHRTLSVEYGIESYFVEEGKGRKIESARNRKKLEVEAALDKRGKALIKSLRMDGRMIE